jgi:hypothetical protein
MHFQKGIEDVEDTHSGQPKTTSNPELVDKVHNFTSVSPAIHSTKFSILTITRGRYNRPVTGRRAELTQFGLHPPLCKLKKKRAQFTCKGPLIDTHKDGKWSTITKHG